MAKTIFNTSVLWICFVLISIYTDISQGDVKITDSEQCVTTDNQPGTCKELTKCPPLAELAMNGGLQMSNEIRVKLKQDHCGFNGSIPKVCCPPVVLNSNVVKSDRFAVTTDNDASVVLPNVLRHRNIRLLPPSCGILQQLAVRPELHDYPWRAMIEYNSLNGVKKFGCGGAVITYNYILTAAHCLTNLDGGLYVVGVRLGDYDLTRNYDCEVYNGFPNCFPAHVDHLIEESFYHEAYNPRTRENDIGLIRLKDKVDTALNPICLPTTPEIANRNFEKEQMIISGWGLNLVANYSTSKYKRAIVPVVDNLQCATAYGRTPIRISEKTLCAGGHGASDSCFGDSGGPIAIQMPSSNDFILIGVVSVGPDRCGVIGSPSVFTRVSSYVDWILDRIRQ